MARRAPIRPLTFPHEIRMFAALADRFEGAEDGERDHTDTKLMFAFALLGFKEFYSLEFDGVLDQAYDYAKGE